MHTNRLAGEKSPYLLQHAHNPVDWYPWGPDAFAKARLEDKPVFLSVGYSTCHWCHVMERESFEDERTAEILNREFVPVKVDREERPDVDRIYMAFVQATTGGGGWPMSVWLTPELKPFFGGTYFPPEDRYGRAGFPLVLERVAQAWRDNRAGIEQSSERVLEELRKNIAQPETASRFLDQGPLESGFLSFRRMFDARFGGFGGAPKFPRPSAYNFLLREYARTGNAEALDIVLTTLRAMARGGMCDHLGGGFHRYSVDERWFVPHFEKMLYDQAQLAVAYLEAFQITGDEFFAGVARDVLEYVLRDMTAPEGGFYSAEDADSLIGPEQPGEKGEGAFYVWSRAEIEDVLGPLAAERFCGRFGVEEQGNVREDPHGEFVGKNILFETGASEAAEEGLEAAKVALLAARARRPKPHLDDKILTAWNGLMVSAFAAGARVLEEKRYEEAARRAAGFILERLYDSDTGILMRRYRDGEAAIPGFLDDYAFFAQALLDLYETCFEVGCLETALRLVEKQRELFEDTSQGGFFSTATGDETLLMRVKDEYDGAEPSGNSIAALNLLRLWEITGRKDLRESASRTLEAFASNLKGAPMGVPQMLVAMDRSLGRPLQLILVGGRNEEATAAMLRDVRRRFLPHKAVLLVDSDSTRKALVRWQPSIGQMARVEGRPAAYVCRNQVCLQPVTDVEALAELLK